MSDLRCFWLKGRLALMAACKLMLAIRSLGEAGQQAQRARWGMGRARWRQWMWMGRVRVKSSFPPGCWTH
jgi:hypothetical protein